MVLTPGHSWGNSSWQRGLGNSHGYPVSSKELSIFLTIELDFSGLRGTPGARQRTAETKDSLPMQVAATSS